MMHSESPPVTFDRFFVDEFPRLVSILTARTGDRATAEDLAQDALLEAERRWPTVSTLDQPATWVRRVALNRSINEHRRRGRERGALDRVRGRVGGPAITADLPNADLWAAVRELPEQQRDAIVLHYVDDLPLAQIAEVLGCAPGTVKTHLSRGRQALARFVDNSGENTPSTIHADRKGRS